MPRLKYSPAPDKNHRIPLEFLRDRCGGFESHKDGLTNAYTANYRGVKILLIDLSKFGGVLTDWIIENTETEKMFWIECKTPEAFAQKNHKMTDGEAWLKGHVSNFRFCVTDDDIQKIMDELYE